MILTLGEQGAVYADGREECRQAAIPAQAVDTTGAGDTFMGYFLAGRFEEMSVREAMVYASQAAAIAITRHGASPAIPTRDEVRAAMAQ